MVQQGRLGLLVQQVLQAPQVRREQRVQQALRVRLVQQARQAIQSLMVLAFLVIH